MNLTDIFEKIKLDYPDFIWFLMDGETHILAHGATIQTNYGECHFGFRYWKVDGNEQMKNIIETIQRFIND